jgi:hypothetical protein
MSSYDTREEARRALGEQGYQSAFSSPGRPELWIKGKSRMAIARRVVDADEDWIALPYPEPSTATCMQVHELAKRDGIVLNAGKQPNPEDVTLTASVEIDPDEDLL